MHVHNEECGPIDEKVSEQLDPRFAETDIPPLQRATPGLSLYVTYLFSIPRNVGGWVE